MNIRKPAIETLQGIQNFCVITGRRLKLTKYLLATYTLVSVVENLFTVYCIDSFVVLMNLTTENTTLSVNIDF